MVSIGEMLNTVKMLRVFWALTPLTLYKKNALNRGNVKHVKI